MTAEEWEKWFTMCYLEATYCLIKLTLHYNVKREWNRHKYHIKIIPVHQNIKLREKKLSLELRYICGLRIEHKKGKDAES